jgi:16S rRNA (adenine1518-N6/adenine1519-N6)-dimethyltransferase
MMQQKRFRASKILGQHFLQDDTAIRRIIGSLNLKAEDAVLEIGCGTGALTQRLVEKTERYLGIELDARLFRRLEERFANSPAIFLNADILALSLDQLQKEYLPPSRKFKVAGNVPYYISSPIINHLARHARAIELAVIMLQSEVADRLLASPGTKEYGFLTLLGEYYFEREELFSVPPQAFRPVPKVFSKVLRLMPKPSRSLISDQEDLFFGFVKQAFSQRRKTLRNCLKGFKGVKEERLRELLEKHQYPPDVRAERVSLGDFIEIYLGVTCR